MTKEQYDTLRDGQVALLARIAEIEHKIDNKRVFIRELCHAAKRIEIERRRVAATVATNGC